MSKFPVLNLARVGINLLAALAVVAGLVEALRAGSYFGSFSFGSFANTFLVYIAIAFVLLITSELIYVALRVEDHLDRIRYIQERGAGIERSELEITGLPLDSTFKALKPVGEKAWAFTSSAFAGLKPIGEKTFASSRAIVLRNPRNSLIVVLGAAVILLLIFFVGRPIYLRAATPGVMASTFDNYLVKFPHWVKVDNTAGWTTTSIEEASRVPSKYTPGTWYCLGFSPAIHYTGASTNGNRHYQSNNVILRNDTNGSELIDFSEVTKSLFAQFGCNNWTPENDVSDNE